MSGGWGHEGGEFSRVLAGGAWAGTAWVQPHPYSWSEGGKVKRELFTVVAGGVCGNWARRVPRMAVRWHIEASRHPADTNSLC